MAAKIDIPEAAIEPYGRHKAKLNIAATCGEIMTMPGLPRMPAEKHICLGTDGTIEGLS